MKYGSRSQTNGQQAPISRCWTVHRQASRSLPFHTASITRNLTNSLVAQASSSTINTVSTILNGVDSRLARSHPSAPVIAAGGTRGAIVARRTKAISATARSPSAMVMALASPFHQRHAAVVDIHECRRGKADHEIDEHRDGHDLDRLPCLVEHGAGKDLHQVRITDRHGQRRVLGEIEILARQRRG